MLLTYMLHFDNLPNLLVSPELIIQAEDGDCFMIDGNLLQFHCKSKHGTVYLSWENTEDTFAALGNKLGYCLMTRQELYDTITSGEYFIE